MKNATNYIPALRYKFLTPLFDPLIRVFMRESAFKKNLVIQANLKGGYKVLDLGCGTGTLAILIKKSQPDAEVYGLDADEAILDIAREKALRTNVELKLDLGMAQSLPYPENSFDRILSSLVLHHLKTENKQHALDEVYRVLKPGGELHLADFGQPNNVIASAISLFVRLFEEVADNIKGLLPEMISKAGFIQLSTQSEYMTVFGTLSLWKASKPQLA